MIEALRRTGQSSAAVAQRLGGWWLTVMVLLGIAGVLAPQQFGILNFKVLQVALAIAIAYLADRSLFKNAEKIQSLMPRDSLSAARLLARAIVAHAVINGLATGL